MEIQNSNIEKNYQDLLSGKIKYFIVSHTKEGVGKKPSWIKIVIWNLIHRKKRVCDYPSYINSYKIITIVTGKGLLIRTEWNDDDLRNFISNYNLKVGDKLTVDFIAPNNYGGFWYAGGREYLITKEGWQLVDKIRGM